MLYLFVLILSTCALVYEFLLSTLSSYLIGNSVLQFSLTIGTFLSGIGIGSFLSRYVTNGRITFFYSEISLALLGGFSAFLVKFFYIYFFNYLILFYVFYFLIVILIGMLVGFEIPILGNLVGEKQSSQQKENNFKKLISDVFTYDYVGAIVATFAFPFILLPYLGLTYTALFLGFFNLIVAFLFLYEDHVKSYYQEKKILLKYTLALICIMIFYIIGGWLIKNHFESFWDHFFYKEPIIFKTQSKYQEIVITKRGDDIRLLLDHHLQFLSLDEKRYHSALWAVPETLIKKDVSKNKVLILGGGDGLLARNVLQTFGNNPVEITLVDLDPLMTHTAQTQEILVALNKGSLLDPQVKIVNIDAFAFLSQSIKKDVVPKYDYIIADFTDPRDVGVAKLYAREFYMMIQGVLEQNGVFVTQSGNAFFARESFWCIHKTLASVFGEEFRIIPYRTYIPSFGDWGFQAVVKKSQDIDEFYKNTGVVTHFDADYLVDTHDIEINTIENPSIIRYFTEGWRRFNL